MKRQAQKFECLSRFKNHQTNQQRRRYFTSDRCVQEHDVVLLRSRGDKKPKWRLTPTLRPDQQVKLPYGGSIPGSQIIGRRYLDAITDSKGREVIVHEASLGSYIVNSERMATPIYPQDAATIVSMMDLHPERPGEEEEEGEGEVFEVFEAGTGMGSLTLYIARALHAANPAMTREMRSAVAGASIKRRMGNDDNGSDDNNIEQDNNTQQGQEETNTGITSLTLNRLDVPDPTLSQQIQSYATSRRAILHTLDRNDKHSREAFKFVRKFRRGIYLPTVDFHIGSVHAYLTSRLSQTNQTPFLSRAVLDLPSAEEVGQSVIDALRVNGLLVVFNPSVSQIASFAAWAGGFHSSSSSSTSGDDDDKKKKKKQRLRLERVAELSNTVNVATDDPGVNDGGGGRPWDVRSVVPREGGDVVQVMRPKVGDRVAGGGFVAVFRKLPEREEAGGAAAVVVGAQEEKKKIQENDGEGEERV